jgi:hypothetical protein
MRDKAVVALRELLIRLEMCTAEPVEYSVQKQLTLWDCYDRVDRDNFSYYVTLRHFSGEFMGRHVGLTKTDIVKFERGEQHTYRFPLNESGELDDHMIVYVYNPLSNRNGPLSFEIQTTDENGRIPASESCVTPDTCPEVAKLYDTSIERQIFNVTVLKNKDHDYKIRLCILMVSGQGQNHTN